MRNITDQHPILAGVVGSTFSEFRLFWKTAHSEVAKSVTEGLEEHWDNGEAKKLAVSTSSYRTNAKTFLFGKSDNDQKKKKTAMVNLNKKDELGKGLLANDICTIHVQS